MRAPPASSVTSATQANAPPPPASISRATAFASASLVRALTTTAAPAAARSRAIARPDIARRAGDDGHAAVDFFPARHASPRRECRPGLNTMLRRGEAAPVDTPPPRPL